MKKKIAISLFVLLGVVATLPAASPPNLLNYQGVLRDDTGRPVPNGDYDMVFRLFDAHSLGNMLLTDSRTELDAVNVESGLFTVTLGEYPALVTPGVYASLGAVFAGENEVYLEVQVGGDPPMTPRIRLASAAYALNADSLDGKDAGEFLDTSPSYQVKLGTLESTAAVGRGLIGRGPESGGYFEDSDGSGYAVLGVHHTGIQAHGEYNGGRFWDTDDSGYAILATGDVGMQAYGATMGGFLTDQDDSGFAYVGYGNRGIEAGGTEAGGYFADSDGTSYAFVGYGNRGIEASGTETGGYFADSDGTSYAYVGYGNYGIYAVSDYGGLFKDQDSSAHATLGGNGYGIWAEGNTAGGYFVDRAGLDSRVYVAHDDLGIEAYGNASGGYFVDNDQSGYAYVGRHDNGGEFYGYYQGVYGLDINSGVYGRLAWGTSSTAGNGTKNFIQNHPYDRDRVVVYAAPEGDEVATYTRGTASLQDGVARISLGETYRWVTNPDIGLTAHLTPRGEPIPLAVVSLSTTELVVRGPSNATGIAFDYLVYGLRIGFEEVSIVRPKEKEANIPSMKGHRDLYKNQPELRRYTALERFKTMRAGAGMAEALDLTASETLRAAIEEYDPAVHGPRDPRALALQSETGTNREAQPPQGARIDATDPSAASPPSGASEPGRAGHQSGIPSDDAGEVHARSVHPRVPDFVEYVPVSSPVEAGDVLVLDPERPGRVKAADLRADDRVVGVVWGDPRALSAIPEPSSDGASDFFLDGKPMRADLEAPLAVSGIVRCKVDAGYGSIEPGDLLTTSPTPGHAMRTDGKIPGTVLGKAMEALEAGKGMIRVLVTLR